MAFLRGASRPAWARGLKRDYADGAHRQRPGRAPHGRVD